MKRTMAILAGLLAGTCLVSCATRHEPARQEECPPPVWTQNPKINDSVNLYRIGSSRGEPTAASAREAAYKDALRQITQTILRECPAFARNPAAVPLEGAEIIPGCSYTVKTGTGYDGWVQVSYPLAQKNQLIESLKAKNQP